MILSDHSLRNLLPQLIKEPDYDLINPASVDIRIGQRLLFETPYIFTDTGQSFQGWALNEDHPFTLHPGAFVLVETYEHITIPNGYACELKLKSSMARKGFNHSLAFWVDPGWTGILTMEISNVTQYQQLLLEYKMRFAQIIIHRLDQDATPYSGRYQNAGGVEAGKP